jgi:hypothetical protein
LRPVIRSMMRYNFHNQLALSLGDLWTGRTPCSVMIWVPTLRIMERLLETGNATSGGGGGAYQPGRGWGSATLVVGQLTCKTAFGRGEREH